MEHAPVFALVVAAALATGCASAQAQDEGGGHPPDAPEGQREILVHDKGPRGDYEKRIAEAAERQREALARLRDAEARVAQLKEMEKRPDADPELRQATQLLERARVAAMEAKERMGASGDPFARGPGQRSRDRREAEMEEQRRYMRDRFRPEGGGPGADGHRPSLEQRMEQLERAVREMHAMFERHGLPPEARERAEREMRDRRDGPGPEGRGREGGPGGPPHGERGRDGGAGRHDGPRGPGGPGDAGGPDRPPRPPVRMPRFEISPEERRAIGEAAGAAAGAGEEARKQLDGARAEIDALRRQLEETRAAMEKMRAELEQLREKK